MIKDVKIDKEESCIIGITIKMKNGMELFITEITLKALYESGECLKNNIYTTNSKLLPFLQKLRDNY